MYRTLGLVKMVLSLTDYMSVCWSGLHGPIAYSLLGGGIPIPEQWICGTLGSVPIFLVYYFPVKRWFWSPPLSPLQDSPGFLAQCSFPVSSLFSSYCLLSVRVCSVGRPPPAASGHSVSVRRKSTTLRLTANQCPLLVSCPESRMKVSPPLTCVAGGTWIGCGWRSEGYGAPRDGLEFLNALTGVAQLAFLCQRSWTLVDYRVARCIPST